MIVYFVVVGGSTTRLDLTEDELGAHVMPQLQVSSDDSSIGGKRRGREARSQ